MPAHRRHRPVKKKARTKKVVRKKPRADLVLLEAASRLLVVVERLEKLLDRQDGDRPTVAMGEASFCPSCASNNPLRQIRENGPCDDPWHRVGEEVKPRCPSCGGPPGSIVEHCMDPWHERHPKA